MLTRREWLALTSSHLAAAYGRTAAAVADERIRRIIEAYERQGIHRTATDVDRESAEWLAREVRDAGLTPALESFSIDRIDIVDVSVTANGRRLDGVPLFDGAFTDAAGVSGRLGSIGGEGDIVLTQAAPNTAASGPLGDARRANRHRAIICVTRGGRPGLCPSNADSFLHPSGPPVVQVSSEEGAFLEDCARQGTAVRVVARVTRTAADAFNVVATRAGADRAAPPLVIMTPRSGWWTCASERGGGIAGWLELMRGLAGVRTARDVLFVASSGHELGHLGVNAFIDRRPGIVPQSAGWIHFGANVGAAQDPGNTIQSSDDAFESRMADAMIAAGLRVDRRVPRGTVPNGEAEAVHRGGGRYMSVIGRNALFHNPADRGPDAVDAPVVARFADAFTTIARTLGTAS